MAARSPAARKSAAARTPAAPDAAAPGAEAAGTPGAEAAAGLDRLIHERVRLAIVSALAGADSLSFNDLKALTATTDGNLSVHARRLEEAGYVASTKSFVGRLPHTEYRLTRAGRRALNEYLDHMETLIRNVRQL
jgi:DNA-binding HxlR family transcriptional regulator